tara:strand:+ start:4150 stop:5133 length:984 start_codon:yes stop_codon:yes gene_type:complete
MIKELIIKKILTDKEVSDLEGTWIDNSFIKHPVINSDTDVYYLDENNEKKLLLKFRKNVISDELIDLAWDSYKDLAKPSRGRGAAAGPINLESVYWKQRELVDTIKWWTKYINKKGEKSKMKVNNQVLSSPIGYYESINSFTKLPCRLTHFTKVFFEQYKNGIPFLQRIDELFKELTPDRYKKQLDRANKQPNLKIDNTSFSTVTINRNFRTALHKDGNDFKEGFGNLTVIEKGKYHGGYTVFPQFGVAIDLRNNDFAAMDVHQWHANTEIYETEEDIDYNKKIKSEFKDNPKIGTEGIYTKYTRLTFVCYLREKILFCNKENENII